MTGPVKKIPFLVVSHSPYMRGILKFVLETLMHTEVTELESEEKAMLFLKEVDVVPSMIVYDYTSNAFLLEDFVAYLTEHSKNIRIIVLVDHVRQEGKELLKNIEQLKLMNESGIPSEIVAESKDLFANTPHLNEDLYCRIDSDFLTILDGINKNLYIKLGPDKYVKVFSEDESTSGEEIKRYIEKGVKYFYLRRETALWVISQMQNQINIFLKANNFRFILRGASDTPEKRFEQKIIRIDEEVHLDKDFQKQIEEAVIRVKAIIEKEENIEKLVSVLTQHESEYAFFTQKMNLSSVIACALARELEWISKTTIDKLVYAAVICDITLAIRPNLIKISSKYEFDRLKSQLSDEEQRIWLSHPKDGASLIKNYFRSAPPETDALAYQHHEAPDGSGFPLGLRADRIAPLTALFIIANDFAYYYLTDEDPSMADFLLKSQSRYDFVNFRKVLKALEKMQKK